MIIVGAIVVLFGIGALFNPNIARWINAPGGERIKALIALLIGAIIIAVGLIFEIPSGG